MINFSIHPLCRETRQDYPYISPLWRKVLQWMLIFYIIQKLQCFYVGFKYVCKKSQQNVDLPPSLPESFRTLSRRRVRPAMNTNSQRFVAPCEFPWQSVATLRDFTAWFWNNKIRIPHPNQLRPSFPQVLSIIATFSIPHPQQLCPSSKPLYPSSWNTNRLFLAPRMLPPFLVTTFFIVPSALPHSGKGHWLNLQPPTP